MIDLTNLTQGKLKILHKDEKRKCFWVCECNCGKIWSVHRGDLRRTGRPVRSCKECARPPIRTTHNLSKTQIYKTWASMINRCYAPSHQTYKFYGAKGITVYKEWIGPGGFEKFYAEIGPKPSADMTLDRIDSTKNYEPGNIRWATNKTQQRNRLDNVLVSLNSRKITLAEADEILGKRVGYLSDFRRQHKVTHQQAVEMIQESKQ